MKELNIKTYFNSSVVELLGNSSNLNTVVTTQNRILIKLENGKKVISKRIGVYCIEQKSGYAYNLSKVILLKFSSIRFSTHLKTN